MTTYSLCSAPLLALSFRPSAAEAPRNPRRVVHSAACRTERVLGALYRLSREAEPATLQRLALVIGLADAGELVAPLARLAKDGMVQKRGNALTLSLTGFAAAAALAVPRNRSRQS